MEGDLRDRRLIDAAELAQVLGVRRQWVYDQKALGRIPYYKVGKYVRFDAREVLQHMRGDAA